MVSILTLLEEIDGAHLVCTRKTESGRRIVYVWRGGGEIEVWEVTEHDAQAVVNLRLDVLTREEALKVIEHDFAAIYANPVQTPPA